MAEQLVDIPAAAGRNITGEDTPDRREPLVPALIPGWRCLTDALVRAYGEEGPVDVVALHPDRGVALIGFLAEGEQASPEEAREALRTMLHDERFEQRFAGELPIVALPLLGAARSQLEAAVDRAFAGMPAPTVPPGWIDWLVERLHPAARSAEPTSLLAAPRRDEPPPEKAATEIALIAPERRDGGPEKLTEASALLVPAEAPPRSEPEQRPAWLEWGTVLGFAFGIVAALVAGLATVFRNGRLF